jgi:hypothetical protein
MILENEGNYNSSYSLFMKQYKLNSKQLINIGHSLLSSVILVSSWESKRSCFNEILKIVVDISSSSVVDISSSVVDISSSVVDISSSVVDMGETWLLNFINNNKDDRILNISNILNFFSMLLIIK